MSALITFDVNVSKLVANDRGFAKLTMSVDDATNTYGQNAGITLNQSKEQREAKEKKTYVGNGKVVWTDGSIVKAEFVERGVQAAEQSQAGRETPDLPF